MITILGGGIAGVTLARALAVRGGRDIVVFDPHPFASGSTGRAIGGFRTQFASPLNIALAVASRPFFVERAERIHWSSTGYLFYAENTATAEDLKLRAELQIAAGLPITHPDPASLLPFFDTSGIIATNFCHLDGTYHPPSILQLLIEEAQAAGVAFRYECTAQPQDLDAEIIVIACGISSPQVGASLEVQLAVDAMERVVFETESVAALPRNVPFTIDAGTGWAIRERNSKLLVMGPGNSDWAMVSTWLKRYIPVAPVNQPEDHWTGFYEMTFDHHPLVGETLRPGVWASCGFSGRGILQAPAVADSLAAMILGQTPPMDISALSPQRSEPLVDSTQV